ncbi:MAG: glutamine-hydrolyzing GMP synthase [candidate division Zixibacteria bacterium]
MTSAHNMILILDFGSQYTQLIARKIREASVYCEIAPYNVDMSKFDDRNVAGIILSGGPASLGDPESPRLDPGFYETGKPLLGICYGMQLILEHFGGKQEQSLNREYGKATFHTSNSTELMDQMPPSSQVWMSHGDSVVELPDGFEVIGRTDELPVAAVQDTKRRMYGLQFHPEVHHTEQGKQLLSNFLIGICGLRPDWTTESFVDETVAAIRKQVGDKNVILGISGGVDSSVAAMLLTKAIGDRLHGVFVDNGLLRKNEFEDTTKLLGKLGINLHPVDASDLFLDRLEGISDPEQKRKVIGNTFIDVFEEQAERLGDIKFLAQGTLYPDVIESVSFKGPSVTIKTHHNVGGLKDRMKFELIEPLRELFKDEVRRLGRSLGLPEQFIGRHPFPGPGLAVRILGEITRERCQLLREVDAIFIDELHKHEIYDEIWQAFVVLLPIKAVGVMGDDRTYENVVSLRAVTSVDGMTADWARIDPDILALISNRIIRNVAGVNRVCYDISSKPPATIEWE